MNSNRSKGSCLVGSSLRKKFGKRQTLPEIKITKSDEDDTSSTGSSSDDPFEAAIEQSRQRSIHSDYLSVRAFAQGRLKAPQERLSEVAAFRYRNIEALRQKNMEASAIQAAAEAEIASERSRNDRSSNPPAAAQRADPSTSSENGLPKETKRINGVEFEMMRKQAGSSSSSGFRNSDAGSLRERRQTRSQTKQEARSNSQDSLLQPPEPKDVKGLTIRKVRDADRTPSPRAVTDEDEITPASPDPLTVSPKKNGKEPATRPLPPTPDSEEASSGHSRLPVSPGSNIVRPKLSSYRRSQSSKYQVEDVSAPSLEPTPVVPPIFSSRLPANQIWTSALSSTSRPREPWAWPKRWTCCQCADLDPFGRDEPAQTIVEQKICSRLECGHERCRTGCRI